MTEEERIDFLIRNTVAGLAFEGMECTEADIARLRRIATGETTAEEEVAKIVARYKGGKS